MIKSLKNRIKMMMNNLLHNRKLRNKEMVRQLKSMVKFHQFKILTDYKNPLLSSLI